MFSLLLRVTALLSFDIIFSLLVSSLFVLHNKFFFKWCKNGMIQHIKNKESLSNNITKSIGVYIYEFYYSNEL